MKDFDEKYSWACGVIHDITQRKKNELLIKASLEEKDVLLREIHHRVKNNLQTITSLINLTKNRTRSEEAIELFNGIQSKIQVITLIHSRLYENSKYDHVDVVTNTREIVRYLLELFSEKGAQIKTVIEGADFYLPISKAIPLTLSISELVTNSLKHGFHTKKEGTIEISFMRSDDKAGHVSIRVKDDGDGLPEDFDIHNTDGFGLNMVNNLIKRHLKGDLMVNQGKGAEFIIEIYVSSNADGT